MNRKILFILIGVVMLISSMGMAFAEESAGANFADMPDNWSTDALQKAVSNGLLGGYVEAGKQLIKADSSLTRAEMATIVNRAFAAEKKGAIGSVSDVSSGAWHAGEMAKAVKMGTFMLDTKMRPNDGITRQEAFTVLARAFKLVGEGELKALDRFSDRDDIASWALASLAGMTAEGYIQGSDGKLQPQANITRAEFATVMNNLVKQYIDSADEVNEVADGNVIIRVPGVTLKDVTIKGDLIIADGVGDGDVTLDNVTVQGRTVVRGGGGDSIIIKGNSDVGKVIVAKVDGEIRIYVEGGAEVEIIYVDDGSDDVIVEGTFDNLEVAGDDVTVYARDADIGGATVSGDNSKIVVGDGSKVKNGSITGASSSIVVDEGGSVDSVAVSGPGASVEGKGEVKEVEVKEGGDGASITTPKTKTVVDQGVEGVEAGGTPVEGGQTATSNDTGTDATVADTPPPSGGTSRPRVSDITMTADVVDNEGNPIDYYDLSALPYGAVVTVTLETATKDAKIYYTTDGTEPVAEGDVPENSFTVKAGNQTEDAVEKTIKVLATKDGHTDRTGEFTIKFKPKHFTLSFDITVVDKEGEKLVPVAEAEVTPKIVVMQYMGPGEEASTIEPLGDGQYKLETDKWCNYTITQVGPYSEVMGQASGPEGIEDSITLEITLVKVNYPDSKYYSARETLEFTISKLLHNQKGVKVGMPIYRGSGGWPWASSQPVLTTEMVGDDNERYWVGDTSEEGVLTISGHVGEDLPYGSLRITLPDYGYTIDNTMPWLDMNPDAGVRLGGFAYVVDEAGEPVYLGDPVYVWQTLTAEVLPSGAEATYEWQRAAKEDGEYTKIEGATDATYVVGEADLGQWIRVKATSKPGDEYHWGTAESYPVGPAVWDVTVSQLANDYYVEGDTLEFTISGLEPNKGVKVGMPILIYDGRHDDPPSMVWASGKRVLTTNMDEVEGGLYWIGTTDEDGKLTVSGTVGANLPYGELHITLPEYGYYIDDAIGLGAHVGKHTVTFDEDGIEDQRVPHGNNAIKPEDPADRERGEGPHGTEWEYFVAWYTEHPKEGQEWGTAYDFNTPVDADINLYARWEGYARVFFILNDASPGDIEIYIKKFTGENQHGTIADLTIEDFKLAKKVNEGEDKSIDNLKLEGLDGDYTISLESGNFADGFYKLIFAKERYVSGGPLFGTDQDGYFEISAAKSEAKALINGKTAGGGFPDV